MLIVLLRYNEEHFCAITPYFKPTMYRILFQGAQVLVKHLLANMYITLYQSFLPPSLCFFLLSLSTYLFFHMSVRSQDSSVV